MGKGSCQSPLMATRKEANAGTLVGALMRKWTVSPEHETSAVGLELDESFHSKPPTPVAWLEQKMASCWFAPDGERAPTPEPPAATDFDEEEAPPQPAGPLHYAGLGRPWSRSREAAFRSRRCAVTERRLLRDA